MQLHSEKSGLKEINRGQTHRKMDKSTNRLAREGLSAGIAMSGQGEGACCGKMWSLGTHLRQPEWLIRGP